MEDLVRRFRREAAQRFGPRYPEPLRQLAKQFATVAIARGIRRREIAGSLGINELTLQRWLRKPPQGESVPVHEVVVVEPRGGGPVLVMPSGVRVEGLGMGELVSLLEALG